MHFLDYLHLAKASLKTYQRRLLTIVIIISALLTFTTTSILLIQGTETAVLSTTATPTQGQILLSVTPQQAVSPDTVQQKIETTARKYNGALLPFCTVTNTFGEFVVIDQSDANYFTAIDLTIVPKNAIPILTSVRQIADWHKIEFNGLKNSLTNQSSNSAIETTLDIINEVYNSSVKNTISISDLTNRNHADFYIAQILPSNININTLSLRNLNQVSNPLDLILRNIPVNDSATILINNYSEVTKHFIASSLIKPSKFYLTFPNIQSAQAYTQDESNYCHPDLQLLNLCPDSYQYKVDSVIDEPIAQYEALRKVWYNFGFFAIILIIICVLITLFTYSRLLGYEQHNIRLYYSMGASSKQVYGIYIIYLLSISILSCLLAMLLSGAFIAIINLLNTNSLSKIFRLGFGINGIDIFLCGWNNVIFFLIVILLAMAPISVLCNFHHFRNTKQQ